MARGKETGQETRFFLTWIPYEQVRYNSSWGDDTKTRLCHLWQICMLQPVRIYFLSWLLAGNYYMVTLWWCLSYTLIYLLVTHPPLTLLMWVLVLRSDYITCADTLDCFVSFLSNPYTVAHVRYNLVTSWWCPLYDMIWLLLSLYFVRYQSRSHSYYDTQY